MTYDGSGYSTNPVYKLGDFLHERYEINELSPLGFESFFYDLIPDANPLKPNSTAISDGLDLFLGQYSSLDRLPTTIDGFAQAYADFWDIPDSTTPDGNLVKPLLRQFVFFTLGIAPTPGFPSDNTGIDGSVMADISNPANIGNTTLLNDIADRAWGQFLREYSYDSVNPQVNLPSQTERFEDQFRGFLINFATVSDGVPMLGHAGDDVLNFTDIYNAFFDNNQVAFQQFLTNYIKDLMYPGGVANANAFLPSEQVGAWLKKVQEEYSKAISGAAAPMTTSVGESFKKTLILDRIYKLIVMMIGTLQQVAASQADRLRILTQWQSAYTTLQTQIHTFTRGDGTMIGLEGSNDGEERARENLNTYNQTLTENIRSRRSVVQDDAKALQSNLNQSNDSANQQANMATAILQELSTILGAIYK